MNQKLEIWYCLFSNIALDNLQKTINSKNNKYIEIKDLKNHINIDGENIFKNTNFYKFILKNKKREQKKIIKKKHLKKQELENSIKELKDQPKEKQQKELELKRLNEEISKETKEKLLDQTNYFFKEIIVHIIKIRNLYSHKDPNYKDNKNPNHEGNKKEYEKSTRFIKDKLIKNTENNYETDVFQKMVDKILNIFFISMFLFKSEWNEFKEKLNLFLSNEKQNILNNPVFLKYRIVNFKKQILKEQIYLKIINYIKSFYSIKNHKLKRDFNKIAIDLLNFFDYKKNLIIKNDNKNQIIQIIFNNKNDIFLNFRELRKLIILLYLIKKDINLNKSLFKEKELNKKEKIKFDLETNYKSFKNKYSKNSNIDVINILKTFNKVLSNKYNDKFKEYMNQTLFNQLLQFINLKHEKYLNLKHDNTKKIMKEIQINDDEKTDSKIWKSKIMDYILENINSKEKYQEIYKISKKSKHKNKAYDEKTKDTNPIIYTINKKIFNENFIKEKIYSPFFNFKNNTNIKEKVKQNKIKLYLAPILLFFNKKFEFKNENEYEDETFIENLFNDNEKKELILKMKIIKDIFKNKILKSNSNIIEFNEFQESNEIKKYKININPKNYYSEYQKIHSNLFFECFKLLNKEENKKNKVFDDKIILEKMNYYIKNEEKLINLFLENEELKERNWILHRNISKFNSFEDIEEILKKIEKKRKFKI